MQLIQDNVILRELEEKDVVAIAALANNSKIAINLRDKFPQPYLIEDAKWFVNFAKNESSDHRFAIEYQGSFCGIIGLHIKEDVYRKNLELGYWLGEPFWGKGIVTKAIGLICGYGFQNLDCNRIYAGVFEFNPASMKILEKNGFVKEGVLRQSIYKNNRFWDEHKFGLVRDDL